MPHVYTFKFREGERKGERYEYKGRVFENIAGERKGTKEQEGGRASNAKESSKENE